MILIKNNLPYLDFNFIVRNIRYGLKQSIFSIFQFDCTLYLIKLKPCTIIIHVFQSDCALDIVQFKTKFHFYVSI